MARVGRKDIMQFYPYPVVRPGHEEILRAIESNYDKYDVFLIVVPMGYGKTCLRRTIAYWYGDTAMTVPTNTLIQQEASEFIATRKIFGKESKMYNCDYCYNIDKVKVKVRGKPSLSVPHGYLAHRLNRKLWIADEGHKLVEFNQELQSTHVWRKDVNYPMTIYSRQDFETWLSGYSAGEKKYREILDKIKTDDYMIKREVAYLRGKPQDRIRLIPLSPQTYPSLTYGVEKIMLMSATLSDEDVWDLGVQRDKKVLRIEAPSNISKERRPLERAYIGNLNYFNMKKKAPELANRIKELADFHSGKKGLIHATYDTANFLRQYLKSDSRFIFHSAGDSKKQLAVWQASDPALGKVFIASGFEEGLDLKGEDYEWQAIARVPWPSLADPAIKKKSSRNERWYIWKALQKVVQAYGRICRGEEDYGVTYILDGSFERLIASAGTLGLLPDYFAEVL
jgi:hypothetical protein